MWKAPIYRKSYKKYGTKCFLDLEKLKYPICTRGKINCRGIRAAAYYAQLQKNKKIINKTKKLYKKYCK